MSWACLHSSVSHTNHSLSWKWLLLRKISPAPFTRQNSNTAVQVPDLSELIFSWKIFLAYTSRRVWSIKKTFHSMELFFFLYTSFREEIRNWLRGGEGRKGEIAKLRREMSAMNQEESCYFQGLYQFRVWSSKNHINWVNLSVNFFYLACVLEMSFPTVLMLLCLTLCAAGGWRSPDPVQALQGSFHGSQRKAGLTHFLFSFYILALCLYKTSQCGCRLKGTCWKRGEGLEISTDWEVLVS